MMHLPFRGNSMSSSRIIYTISNLVKFMGAILPTQVLLGVASFLMAILCGKDALAQAPVPPTVFAQLDPYLGGTLLPTFRYQAPHGATVAAVPGVEGLKRVPQQQRIVDFSDAGDHAKVAREGLALMSQENVDDGLKLIVANSLAWTGRLKEADKTYRSIVDTPLIADASVGIGNILLWKGQEAEAIAIFQDVLTAQPDHEEARKGVDRAERELAPRTRITVGGSGESTPTEGANVSLAHRWRDDSGYRIYEVESSHHQLRMPGMEVPLEEYTVRYQDTSLELKPAVEITLPSVMSNTLFGSLKLNFEMEQVQLDLGRVNLGRYYANAKVLASEISASHIGATMRRDYSLGGVVIKADYLKVSDGNAIVTGDIRFNSHFRPLGNAIKPYMGFEMRKSDYWTPAYWSPDGGMGAIYGGVQGDWYFDDWNFYVASQVGTGVYGDAGTSWMVSGGAKRWISDNVGLSINLWGMSSTRNGSDYRAHLGNIILEKVWR